jgi:hypothetical protein
MSSLARVLPPIKRVVFAGGATKIDLLRHVKSKFIAVRSKFYENNH